MKFVVAQIGARRSYAVPAILEEAGMLERFYTDITSNVYSRPLASLASALPLIRKHARRLAGRQLPEDIRAKTMSFPALSLGYNLRRAMIGHDPIARFREAIRFSDALGRA